MLTKIILVQRTDSTYDSVDFDDPFSIRSYFSKLFQCTTGDSEEEADRVIKNNLRAIFAKENVNGVRKALSIMRFAAEKIQVAFLELNPDKDLSTINTAYLVLYTSMTEALKSLIHLASSKTLSRWMLRSRRTMRSLPV